MSATHWKGANKMRRCKLCRSPFLIKRCWYCSTCKELTVLYRGIHNRLYYSPKYLHLPMNGVPDRETFCLDDRLRRELDTFYQTCPAGDRPSIDRIYPTKTYT